MGRQHDIQLAEIKRQLLEKTTEHEKACVAIQLFYKEVGKLKRENESLKQSSSNSIGTESMKVKEVIRFLLKEYFKSIITQTKPVVT